jgi:glutamine amidotransferase
MVTIVDYGLGNLFSVAKAFESIGIPVRISADPKDLKDASHIVLPGVGAFPRGMQNLKSEGLLETLEEEVLGKKKPFLGICLGLQLLADKGYEYEESAGLGWIKGEVRILDVEQQGLKVPHIGWNDLSLKKESRLFKKIKSDADFYFVHSYQLHCADKKDVVATTIYGEEITAVIERENICAVQFHPEKSQDAGLTLLENFYQYA